MSCPIYEWNKAEEHDERNGAQRLATLLLSYCSNEGKQPQED